MIKKKEIEINLVKPSLILVIFLVLVSFAFIRGFILLFLKERSALDFKVGLIVLSSIGIPFLILCVIFMIKFFNWRMILSSDADAIFIKFKLKNSKINKSEIKEIKISDNFYRSNIKNDFLVEYESFIKKMVKNMFGSDYGYIVEIKLENNKIYRFKFIEVESIDSVKHFLKNYLPESVLNLLDY